MAHYLIGITFAGIFVAIIGAQWLEHPTLVPAVVFGIVTTLAPFLILQPVFELEIAASRAANPVQVRMCPLLNHLAFGFSLYVFRWLANRLS